MIHAAVGVLLAALREIAEGTEDPAAMARQAILDAATVAGEM